MLIPHYALTQFYFKLFNIFFKLTFNSLCMLLISHIIVYLFYTILWVLYESSTYFIYSYFNKKISIKI